MVVRRAVQGFDIEGPVQAEVFVMWLDGGAPALTGPCGADPWYLEVAEDEDPLDVVADGVRRVIGEPVVVHSTSWRRGRGAVVLSFVTVIRADQVGSMASVPIGRTDLARNTATSGPPSVAPVQVIEHGLRHLAWLVRDDAIVAERLAGEWREALEPYVPEPFRHLR